MLNMQASTMENKSSSHHFCARFLQREASLELLLLCQVSTMRSQAPVFCLCPTSLQREVSLKLLPLCQASHHKKAVGQPLPFSQKQVSPKRKSLPKASMHSKSPQELLAVVLTSLGRALTEDSTTLRPMPCSSTSTARLRAASSGVSSSWLIHCILRCTSPDTLSLSVRFCRGSQV